MVVGFDVIAVSRMYKKNEGARIDLSLVLMQLSNTAGNLNIFN